MATKLDWRARLTACFALFTLALGACGGGPSAPAPAPAPAGAPTTAPAAAKPAANPTSAAAPAPSAAAAPSTPAKVPAGAGTANLAEIEAAAKREGTVTLYTSAAPSLLKPLNDGFQSKYGIKVEMVRAASGPLTTRFAGEAEANKVVADVLQTSDTAFYDQAVQKGWLAKSDGLPAAAEWPPEFWDGTGALSAIGVTGITVNTNKVKPADEPKGWQELLDPKWKGQILLVDPRNVALWLAWLQLLQDNYGEQYLQKLGQQNLRLVASSVPGVQQLAAGEGSVIVPASHWTITELEQKDAPVKWVPAEPTTGVEQIIGIVAKAPHPNAAKL
ncbi:MAG: extracellular solute-binding protein, partial [Chloroflexi bacterium]|nr:extracellular solute-binding protein [Chloroflexota bacterium]